MRRSVLLWLLITSLLLAAVLALRGFSKGSGAG